MSANADVWQSDDFIGSAVQESALRQVEVFREPEVWNPEDFAREQIRGLVQRVFFASGGRPVTQVVFSGAEPHTDVAGLCDQVGQALALETSAHIAVVGPGDDGGVGVLERGWGCNQVVVQADGGELVASAGVWAARMG